LGNALQRLACGWHRLMEFIHSHGSLKVYEKDFQDFDKGSAIIHVKSLPKGRALRLYLI